MDPDLPQNIVTPLHVVVTDGGETDVETIVFVVGLLSRDHKPPVPGKTNVTEDVRRMFDEDLVYVPLHPPTHLR